MKKLLFFCNCSHFTVNIYRTIHKVRVVTFFLLILNCKAYGITCGFALNVENISATLINNEKVQQTVTASITRSSNSNNCRKAFLTFNSGQNANSYDRKLSNQISLISYTLSSDRNGRKVLKDLPDATNSDVLDISFKGNSSQESVHFYFLVDLDNQYNFNSSGSFLDQVNISIYRGSIGDESTPEAVTSSSINLGYPEQTSISIVEPGAPYDETSTYKSLSFGQVETGDVQTVDIIVKSNISYKIQVSSENGGQMRSLEHKEGKARIPYDFYVDNNFKNLRNSANIPRDIFSENRATTQSGRRIKLKFKIGKIKNPPAGYYQDILTFYAITN